MSSGSQVKSGLAKKARIQRALKDPAFFRAYYCLGADLKPFKDGPHHKQMDAAYVNGEYICNLAPVGFAKSEWLRSIMLWEICKDRNTHAIYASHSFEVAKQMMNAIQWNLENNERLIEDFGPFYIDGHPDIKSWSQTNIYVVGNKNPRVPSLTIIGNGGRTENIRVERLYTDDVVNLDSATSEAERNATEAWFFNEFVNRLNRGGKICMIGSRFHPMDLYGKLIDRERISGTWKVNIFKAVLNWDTREVLWPERWPYEELMKRRENIGAPIFEARLQQNPEALFSSYFNPDMLDGRVISPDKVPEIKVIYQGWDFSISQKETADYTAGVTVGVDAKGDWYVLDVFRKHLAEGHSEEMVRQYRKWHKQNPWNAPVNAVMAEKNLFQQLIGAQAVKLDAQVPLVPVQRVRDKITRILRIQPMFQQKRMWFVKTIPDLFNQILPELYNFPNEGQDIHDDFLDALEAAMTHATTAQYDNTVRVLGGLDDMTKRWWA